MVFPRRSALRRRVRARVSSSQRARSRQTTSQLPARFSTERVSPLVSLSCHIQVRRRTLAHHLLHLSRCCSTLRFNVEHSLISAKNRTKLLLSKPTAQLDGDSSGNRPDCGPHTQGSCPYRRNLTIAESSDGGASWTIRPWGLIYPGRAAYSMMAELPDGRIAVVFERGDPNEEYRYLSVAVVDPQW